MASGTSVQFFGKEKVLDAYRARGIECWSIWQGKDLNFAGCNESDLSQYLTMLQGSQGAYQLRLHADAENADDIDNTTAFQGSFRFKLDTMPGTQVSGVVVHAAQPTGIMGALQKRIEDKIAAKYEKILDRLDDDEDDEKELSLNGVIGSLLKDPKEIPNIIMGIRALFAGHPIPQPAPVMGNVSRVSGNADTQPVLQVMTEEEEYERLAAAYNTLKRADKYILPHLEKLAKVSTDNKQMFDMLITSLDNMK